MLSDEEAGLLFKAIFRYADSGEVIETDNRVLTVAFEVFKTQLDRDTERYDKICKKRTAAINKRWKEYKSGQNIQENTNEYKCIQMNTNRTHSDSDSDSDSDNRGTIDSTHDIIDINNNLKETYNINIIDKEKSATNVALNLKKRKEKFVETLDPYVSIYGEELIEDFIGYWTEPNKSLTRMRFELERTWDVKRRLLTWATRASQYKKSYATRQSAQQRTDGAAAIIAQLAAEDDAKRQVR